MYLIRLEFKNGQAEMFPVYTTKRSDAQKSAETFIDIMMATKAEIWATTPHELVMIIENK